MVTPYNLELARARFLATRPIGDCHLGIHPDRRSVVGIATRLRRIDREALNGAGLKDQTHARPA
ncbi:MAG: hypothetical protein GY798_05845 [Hyphomicrobiales bacterium]|nr:hypothetical protein [Hyphomicrobiales bacterium]